MRTVQIVGVAPSASALPPDPAGADRWGFNNPHMYRVRCPQMRDTWTAWFNLHSDAHMRRTYPEAYVWYGRQIRPVYLQQTFPHKWIQTLFSTRYFTCSIAWMMAFAILERFERIELWGWSGDHGYAEQAPCLAYWCERAEHMGIEVDTQHIDFGEAGSGRYAGPLYGYDTT